jgi:hypothetical protein
LFWFSILKQYDTIFFVSSRLLAQEPHEFSLDLPRDRPAVHQHFSRLMLVIQFSFQNLGSTHANVARLARRVFTLAARHTAADTPTFNQVWELLGALDSTLQIRLRKGLAAAIEELYLGRNTAAAASSTGDHSASTLNSSTLSSLLSASSDDSSKAARTPQELDRSAFLEKFLNECSNQHTEMAALNNHHNNLVLHGGQQPAKRLGWRPPLMRSTSHSPSRQLAMSSRSSSRSPSRANTTTTPLFKPQLKPSLCQSVYNINHSHQLSGNVGGGGLGYAKRPLHHPHHHNPPWHNGGGGGVNGHTKPRVLTRLAQKSRLHELAREILPKFDLSFLSQHRLAEDDDDDAQMATEENNAERMTTSEQQEHGAEMSSWSRPQQHSVTKSRSMTRLVAAASSSSSRNTSPTKGGFIYANAANTNYSNRSPPVTRKRGGSRDSGTGSTTTAMTSSPSNCGGGGGSRLSPQTSPLLLHRDKRSGGGCGGGGSCKDLVAYEESLALALALSKSIYHETPLPVIPGLSRNLASSHEVFAHPHRDVSSKKSKSIS